MPAGAYSAGTAFLQVVPSFRGIEAASREAARQIAREVDAGLTQGIRDGLNNGARAAAAEGARAGREYGRGFGSAVRRELEAAFRALPDAPIDADLTPFHEKLARMREEIATLRDAHVRGDLDDAEMLIQIRDLRARLSELARSSPNVQVRADVLTAAARLEAILGLARRVDEQNPTVRVRADDRASGSMTSLAHSVGLARAQLQGLVAVAPLLTSAIVPAAFAAAAAVASIGTAAIAGVGTVVLGLKGVGGAVTALHKYQQDSAKSAASLGTSENRLAGSLDSVASAERGLANTRASVASAAQRAAQQVVNAQRDVIDAQRQARQAQLDLVRAYEEARRAQEDQVLSLREVALARRQANLDIADAKKQLDAIMVNPRATEAEREQARVTYEQRVLQLDKLAVQEKRLQADKSAADQAGIEGSQQVQSAQEQVRRATEQVAKAQQSVADAVTAQKDQQREGLFQVEQAEQAVANAARQVESATLRAGVAGGAALQNLKTAFDNLSPAGQRFAQFLFGLKPQLDTLRAAAQGGLLPGLQQGLEGLLPIVPELTLYVGRFAAVIGELAAKAGQALGAPYWRDFGRTVGDNVIVTMRTGYAVVTNFGLALAGLTRALLPLGQDVGAGLLSFSQRLAQWSMTLSTNRGFQDLLNYVRAEGPIVAGTIGELVQAIGHIAKAIEPIGGVSLIILRTFAQIINAMPTGVITTLAVVIGGLVLAKKEWALVTGTLNRLNPQLAGNTRLLTSVINGAQNAFASYTARAQAAGQSGHTFGASLAAIRGGASAAGAGLSSLVSTLGGPWAIAIAAATIGVSVFMHAAAEQKARVDSLAASLMQLGTAYRQTHNMGDQAVKDIILNNDALTDLVNNTDAYGVSVGQVTRAAAGEKDAQHAVLDAMDRRKAALLEEHKQLFLSGQLGSERDKQINREMLTIDANRAAMVKQFGQINANEEANKRLSKAIGLQESDLQDVNDVLHTSTAGFEQFQAVITGVANSTIDDSIKYEGLAAIADRVSSAHLDAADKAKLFGQVLSSLGNATDTSGPKFHALADTFGSIAASALNASDKANLLKQALDQLYGASISQDQADDRLAQTQASLSQQLEQNAVGFDIKTAKTEADRAAIVSNRQALEAALQSTRDKYIADIQAGVAEDQARAAHDAATTAILNQIPPTQRNSQAVQDLNKHFGEIPPAKDTKITVTGMDQARADLIWGFAFQKALSENWNEEQLRLYRLGLWQRWINPNAGGGLAEGGSVPGWSPHKRADNIAAWLTAKEFVQPVDSVEYYGVDFMEALRRRTIPRELLTPSTLDLFNSRVEPRRGSYPGDGSFGIKYADGGPVAGGPTWPYSILGVVKFPVPLAELERRFKESQYGWVGPVPSNVAGIQNWIRGQAGKPYVWASAGPFGFDCSGIVSAAWNLMAGRNPYSHTFSTSDEGRYFTKPGYGLFTAGWSNPGEGGPGGGPGDVGHTAGNLAGLTFESRGGDGVVVGRGVTNINSFAHVAHMARGGVVKPLVMDQGGWLKPGWNPPVYNGTRQYEKVLNPQQMSDAAALIDRGGTGNTYNFQFRDTTLDPQQLRTIQNREAAYARVGRAR